MLGKREWINIYSRREIREWTTGKRMAQDGPEVLLAGLFASRQQPRNPDVSANEQEEVEITRPNE